MMNSFHQAAKNKLYINPGKRPPVPGSELGAKIFTEHQKTPIENGGNLSSTTKNADCAALVNEISSDKLNSSNSNKIIANNNCDKSSKTADNMQSAVNTESGGDVCAGSETGARRKTLPTAEEGGREREPEGSADITPPFSESSNSNSTPPYIRWSESLRNLVSDQDGMELFAKYLKSENVYFFLEFWFACEGLRKNNADDVTKLVKVINKKFMREQQVPVSEDTRKNIQDRIKNKDVNRDIFDGAQAELEQKMTETVYRNFLASEEYLNYVQKMQIGESDFSAKASGSHSTASSVSGRHIQDDSGHFSVPIEVEKPKAASSSSRPGETGTTSDSTSGISETSSSLHHHHHASISNHNNSTTFNSTTMTSVQHNNTANNHSVPASTLDESDCAQLIQSLSLTTASTLPTLHENSELDLTKSGDGLETSQQHPGLSTSLAGGAASLTNRESHTSTTTSHNVAPGKSQSLLGLTSHSLMMTERKRRHIVKPEAFAGHYLHQAGGGSAGGPRNPYHVSYNSAYNPVSRQDSELQSLSSDAHTTDDNMSSFTEGSSHSYRQITSKKHIQRQLRKAHEQSQRNSHNNVHGVQALIPRTQRVPPEATQPRKPADFAAELIEKLEKVKEEQDKNERLQSKLEETHSLISQDSSRSYADYLKHNKLSFPDEPLETILDKHFSSVSHFSDKTPVQLRSPGDPTGRPRSPRSMLAAAAAAGGGGSMGPPQSAHHHHRTLPGRGGQSRGQMMGGGSLQYHQDLAYFDNRRGGRMDPPPPPPVQQDNKNNFVREWVADVERQSGGTNTSLGGGGLGPSSAYDQRSQQSGSRHTKTSPRSGRHKAGGGGGNGVGGVRAASSDRSAGMMMSTSWSAGSQAGGGSMTSGGGGSMLPPGHYGHQKGTQLQLEEANRKLASLAHNASLGHHSASFGHHNSSLGHLSTSSNQGFHVPPGPQQAAGSHSNNSTLRRGAAGAPKHFGDEFTVAVYTFSQEKDPMPYRIKIYTKNVTLRNVKDLLPKKGSFRFYFKTEVDGETFLEEETEDSNPVPLWEGKVIVQCRNME